LPASGAACASATDHLDDYGAVAALRDAAERRLGAIAPDAVVYGGDVARLPNTLCIAMPGVAAATQVMAARPCRLMVSAGAACSSGKVRRSHVLDAMGVPAAEAEMRHPHQPRLEQRDRRHRSTRGGPGARFTRAPGRAPHERVGRPASQHRPNSAPV